MTIVVRPEDRAESSRTERGLEIVLAGEATGGALAVVACDVRAATAGPPLHMHPNSDETFLVQSGTLLLHLDGDVVHVGAGGIVHVPRGTPHTFATPPADGARFITVHTPSGFEAFHAEAARAEAARGRPLAPPELIEIARGHDWQLAGPPLLPDGRLAGTPS